MDLITMDLRMECMQRNDPILLNPSDRTVCRRRFLQSASAGLVSALGLGGCVPSSLDSDASPLPSSRVDLVIRLELAEELRDCCRQRRLAMVNVTDRANVDVRLRPLKLALCHVNCFL